MARLQAARRFGEVTHRCAACRSARAFTPQSASNRRPFAIMVYTWRARSEAGVLLRLSTMSCCNRTINSVCVRGSELLIVQGTVEQQYNSIGVMYRPLPRLQKKLAQCDAVEWGDAFDAVPRTLVVVIGRSPVVRAAAASGRAGRVPMPAAADCDMPAARAAAPPTRAHLRASSPRHVPRSGPKRLAAALATRA